MRITWLTIAEVHRVQRYIYIYIFLPITSILFLCINLLYPFPVNNLLNLKYKWLK